MKYKHRPIEVDAFLFRGDINQEDAPQWFRDLVASGKITMHGNTVAFDTSGCSYAPLMKDWVVVLQCNGDVGSWPPVAFAEKYEPVQ